MEKQKKFQCTYLPFSHSTAESSDIYVTAENEDGAKLEFEVRYPNFSFLSAKEVL